MEVAKNGKLYRDTIETVAASQDAELTEQLEIYFLDEDSLACMTATVYTCFQYFKPYMAMEFGRSYGGMYHIMPFIIHTMKEVGQRPMRLEQ